jgi:hypothetical protein
MIKIDKVRDDERAGPSSSAARGNMDAFAN